LTEGHPFYTNQPAGVGTGLGLSTVYHIVRQSGGWISVYSEKGVGPAWRFTCLARSEKGRKLLLLHERPRKAGTKPFWSSKTAPKYHFIRAVLRSLGYTVIVAAGGAEAVAAFEGSAGPIDLLIIDIVLPDSSGHDVARQLRESRAGLAVLYRG